MTLVGVRGDGTSTASPDPRVRQAITIASIAGTTITAAEDLSLTPSTGGLNYLYTAYPGIGEWGTMLDSGQFNFRGTLEHVDIGTTAGSNWWASFDAADFAGKPTDRTGFDSTASFPTSIAGSAGRWGLTNQQRIERILIWSPAAEQAELAEVELNYRTKFE